MYTNETNKISLYSYIDDQLFVFRFVFDDVIPAYFTSRYIIMNGMEIK